MGPRHPLIGFPPYAVPVNPGGGAVGEMQRMCGSAQRARPRQPGLWLLLAWGAATAGAAAVELSGTAVRLVTDVGSALAPLDHARSAVLSAGPATAGVLFDAATAGVPPRAMLDALLVDGPCIVFSTDVDYERGGVRYADEDLAAWNTATGVLAPWFDGSVHGLPDGADLVAAALEPATGALLFALDIPAQLPDGTRVAANDILRYASNAVSVWRRGADLGIPPQARVDALYHGGHALFFSLDRPAVIAGRSGRRGDVWRHGLGADAPQPYDVGVAARADLAGLDCPVDSDGDGLTDLEETGGSDEPATTWRASGRPLAPGGYRSRPDRVDSDDDGFSDGAEAACGTSPTNALDRLRILAIDREGARARLTWVSAPGRTYAIDAAPSAAAVFEETATRPAAAGGDRTEFADPQAAERRLYKVRLVSP